MNKSITLTLETINRLVDMSNEMDINHSKLIRIFINYFNQNRVELKEIIKGDFDND